MAASRPCCFRLWAPFISRLLAVLIPPLFIIQIENGGGAAPRQEPIACNATSCGYLASRRVFTVVDLFNRSSLVSKLQCQRAPEVIDAPLSQFAPLMNGGRLHPPHLHPFSPRMTCRLWLLSLPGIDAEILGAPSPTPFHLTTQFARWCALRESRGSVLRGG